MAYLQRHGCIGDVCTWHLAFYEMKCRGDDPGAQNGESQ